MGQKEIKNVMFGEERCVKKLKVVNKESADYKASVIVKEIGTIEEELIVQWDNKKGIPRSRQHP